MLRKLKQRFVSWLLKGVHIDELHIGEHSVVISGTGANLDGQKIENVGAPDSDDDVPRRDTIDSKITTHSGVAAAHHAKTGNYEVYANTELVTSLPGASSTYLGRILRERAAAGTKTTVYVCVQNDADGYEWVQIGIST